MKANEIGECKDKIRDFANFSSKVGSHFKNFNVIADENTLCLSETDSTGLTVKSFFHFQEVTSPFGSVPLCKTEKNGFEVPKSNFSLQKNCLLNKWSQVRLLIDQFQNHEHSSDDVRKVIDDLENLSNTYEIHQFCFLLSQIGLLLLHKNKRKFTTQTMIFALQLRNISPSCYRTILKSDNPILPSVKKVKDILSKTVQDLNLAKMFRNLTPQ